MKRIKLIIAIVAFGFGIFTLGFTNPSIIYLAAYAAIILGCGIVGSFFKEDSNV